MQAPKAPFGDPGGSVMKNIHKQVSNSIETPVWVILSIKKKQA